MNPEQFFSALTLILTEVTRIFFILVALLTLAHFARYRDRTHLDIALVFGSLGLIIASQVMRELWLAAPPWTAVLESLLLIMHPYLQLRLAQHFQRVPVWLQWFAFLGMVLSLALVVVYWEELLAQDLPSWVSILIIVEMVFVELYAVVAFVRGAFTTTGVTHWRLLLAAIGACLVAGVLVIAGINAVWDWLQPYAGPVSQLLGLFAGVTYYLGFAPPRTLRKYWQLIELQQFLRESANEPVTQQSTENMLKRLESFAIRTVGGLAAGIALWDESQQALILHSSHPALLNTDRTLPLQNLVAQAWKSQAPIYSPPLKEANAPVTRLAGLLNARKVFVVPILKGDRGLGLLLVFMRYGALFAEDDLALLSLLAEQSATDLDYVKLLTEQRNLVQQLHRRTSQLESANKELEAFSYTVSHDLRAPLRAIDGFTRILVEDHAEHLPAEARESLDLVLENSQQMGRLIDDLLLFSRVGRQEIKTQTIYTHEVVEQVLNDLLRQEGDRPIQTKIGDLPPCEAHPALIKQVWVNLISNALKYTRGKDPARIEIGAEQNNGRVVYYVKDNGVGFDMQYSNKLFGVFQRLHLPEEYEGTGVGLAIVQRIVQQHGGDIWAEAEVNRGAAFYFSLREADSDE